MMECNCLVDMGKHALQLTMAAVVLLGSQALALADDCKSIEDATKRLACYDRTETPPKVTDQQPLNTSLTPAMRELRSRLDKSFLAAGVNMDVMALSKRDEFTTGKLPHLQLLDK